jgi:hypothetical protein
MGVDYRPNVDIPARCAHSRYGALISWVVEAR